VLVTTGRSSSVVFVRKKRVHDNEYYQLVENYRKDGHHRQRVVAHLGKHDTVQGAIDGLREQLEGLKHSKLEEQIDRYENSLGRQKDYLIRRYDYILGRYWQGKIPSKKEHKERGDLQVGTSAPTTDEVIGTNSWSGEPIYAYAEREIPDEVEEYRRAFGEPTPTERVTHMGTRFDYSLDLHNFNRELGYYEYLKDAFERKCREYDHRRQRLRESIEKLESIAGGD
jgi:hypothetical protein